MVPRNDKSFVNSVTKKSQITAKSIAHMLIIRGLEAFSYLNDLLAGDGENKKPVEKRFGFSRFLERCHDLFVNLIGCRKSFS